MEALVAKDVCRRYGEQNVLKDFSLTVGVAGFTALMGPSGSGKSTFLNIAAGLLSADSGTVLVGGENITKMGDGAATRFRRRHVGVVFQAFNLVDTLTVEENIVLPAKLDHRKADRARVAELLGKLDLTDKARRRPAELSGGEQQRVAIARALYLKPDVILADEPTGNLDAHSARAICAILRELRETEKSAILLVTHDPVVAATAEDVCFLRDGAIAAAFKTEGDPALISRRYLETYE